DGAMLRAISSSGGGGMVASQTPEPDSSSNCGPTLSGMLLGSRSFIDKVPPSLFELSRMAAQARVLPSDGMLALLVDSMTLTSTCGLSWVTSDLVGQAWDRQFAEIFEKVPPARRELASG